MSAALRKVRRALAGLTVALMVLLLLLSWQDMQVEYVPLPASGAESLISQHDCWTGAAPADMAGKMPGHVVVTPAGGEPVYSAELVGPALEHVFHGKHPDMRVHAFCR